MATKQTLPRLFSCLAARFQREDSNRLFQTFLLRNATESTATPVDSAASAW
jgi:hypothetical protein